MRAGKLDNRVRFERRDLGPIALLGIGQFGVLIALLNYGLQYIGSALGALIFTTFPLFTMVLAALLGRYWIHTVRLPELCPPS